MAVANAKKPEPKKPAPLANAPAQKAPAPNPAQGKSYAAGVAALKPKPPVKIPSPTDTLGPAVHANGYPEPKHKKKKKKDNTLGPTPAPQQNTTVTPAPQPKPPTAAPVAAKPATPMQDPAVNPDPTNEYAPNAAYAKTAGVVAVKAEGDEHAIDPSDVEQGALGDCYFVAQLAAQAKTNPGRIQDLIKDNGNGTYTVTLHLKDKAQPWKRVPTPIVVDSQFPQKDGSAAYAKPGDSGSTGPELWVMLIEKAFAKYSGSYEQIRGSKTKDGDVFGMMSGVESRSFSPASMGADKLLETLTKALANGQAVSFGAKSKTSADETVQNEAKTEGVVLNHAYSLLKVDAKARTVDLRNPWGVKHLTAFSVDKLIKFYYSVDVAAK
jgi:hypothetical protein